MDTDVTPEENSGNETPEATEEVTPAEGEETPENPTEKPEDGDLKSDPPKQEHDWKKRFDGVDRDHKQLSEEHGKLIDASVKLAEKNPSYLDDLAETDAALADKVSEKLYGEPYGDFKEKKRLEELKDSNPSEYEREQRLRSLEKKEADRLVRAKESFLQEKGIKNNQFDPDYQKLQAQLELLNPVFVEDNPIRAMEIAHGLAFPKTSNEEETAKAADLAKNTNRGGGMSPKLDTSRPALSPQAQAFKDAMQAATGK